MTPAPSTNIIDGPGTELQETTIELIKMHRQLMAITNSEDADDDLTETLGPLIADVESKIARCPPRSLNGVRTLLDFAIGEMKRSRSCLDKEHMAWLEGVLGGVNDLCGTGETHVATVIRPQFGEGDDDGWPCRIDSAH